MTLTFWIVCIKTCTYYIQFLYIVCMYIRMHASLIKSKNSSGLRIRPHGILTLLWSFFLILILFYTAKSNHTTNIIMIIIYKNWSYIYCFTVAFFPINSVQICHVLFFYSRVIKINLFVSITLSNALFTWVT